MPLLTKRSVIAVAIEGTAGTGETLDATDAAFNAYNAASVPNVPMGEREGQSAMSPLAAIAGGYLATISYETDLYTAPGWEAHLQCAGLVEGAGTSADIWTVSTVSSNWKTATVAQYKDGQVYEIIGAMCNVELVLTAGQVAKLRWTWTGAANVAGARWGKAATILAPTYPLTAASAPRWSASTLTLGGAAILVSSITINLNNQITMLEDPTKAAGFGRAWIGSRKVGGTMDPEEALSGTRDDFGIWFASTQQALSIAYGSMSISIPKLQFMNLPTGDRSGASILNATWQANRSAVGGDDEFVLDLSV